ncbi:hypothetical protein J6W32_04265 [bacterium]|nr:hypothetical protein [bacterium]
MHQLCFNNKIKLKNKGEIQMDITLDGTPFKLLGDKPLIKVGDAARDA